MLAKQSKLQTAAPADSGEREHESRSEVNSN